MSAPAAARARYQATALAAGAAVVPTVLAAEGMTALAVDLLGFPVLAAVALACFLELALVASALLARAAALAGRPGGADAAAVWVVSGTSGLLAGVHQVMTTTPSGTVWSVDPGSVLAGVARVIAPLVAAWLWERVLHAARAEQAERTLAEVRRDRRNLAVARAALYARRLDDDGRMGGGRGRRAVRRLERAHMTALRVTPPSATLAGVLAAVGQVDHLPAATRAVLVSDVADTGDVTEPVEVLTGHADEVAGQVEPPTGQSDGATAAGVAAGLSARSNCPAALTLAITDRPDKITAQVVTAPTLAGQVEDVADTSDTDVTDPLAAAVEMMANDPDLSGAALSRLLAAQGWPVSVRSGQRLRAKARAALAADTPVMVGS